MQFSVDCRVVGKDSASFFCLLGGSFGKKEVKKRQREKVIDIMSRRKQTKPRAVKSKLIFFFIE